MRARLSQNIAFFMLTLCGLVVIAPIVMVIAVLIIRGAPAISIEFLTQMPRAGMKEGGIFPAIIGTVILVAGAVAVAVPLGVTCAIYITEYARDNLFTRLVRLSIVNLAGVPSVVFGLFGLGLFVIFLKFGSSIL